MTDKMIMACNEKIIHAINDAVKYELKRQLGDSDLFGDPDIIDQNLLECSELCDKIISTNYFEHSEEILNKSIHNLDTSDFARLRWEKAYKEDLNNKKSDMRRVFDLILNYSEDWC